MAQQAAILNTKNFNVIQRQNMASSLGLAMAEDGQTVSTIALSTSESAATVATGGLGVAVQGLGVKLKMLAAAHPILLGILAAGLAIGAVVNIFHAVTTSVKEQEEAFDNAKSEYEDATSKLSELNSALSTTKDRIKELQDKAKDGTITLAEQNELGNLKQTNVELEKQIANQKIIQAEKNKKQANEASKTFYAKNETMGSDDKKEQVYKASFTSDLGFSVGNLEANAGDNFEFYDYAIEQNKQKIEEYKATMSSLQEQLANETDSDNKELIQGDIDYNQKLLTNLEESNVKLHDDAKSKAEKIFPDKLTEYYEYKTVLMESMNSDGGFDDESIQETWDDIESRQKALYKAADRSGDWNTMELDTVVSDSSLSDVMNQIRSKLNEGTLTSDDISSFSNLNGILGNTNLILEDGKDATSVFIEYLNKLKESGEFAGEAISSAFDNTDDILKLLTESDDKTTTATLADLQSEADLLSSVKKEMADTGTIGVSAMQNIIKQYPEAKAALADYMSGHMTLQELFAQLENVYTNDKDAYINSLVAKNSKDGEFFNALKQTYPELFAQLGELYGKNVNDWSNMEQAKYGITTNLIQGLTTDWSSFYSSIGNQFGALAAQTSGFLTMVGNEVDGYRAVGTFDDSDIALTDPEEAAAMNAQFDALKDEINNSSDMVNKFNSLADLGKSAYDFTASGIDLSWQGMSDYDSSSSSGNSFSEQINWLERLQKSAERVYNRISKVVSDTTKSWTTRNSALNDSISAVIAKLNAQQASYENYMSLANAVGLDSSYINAIQNGDSRVQTITDENLKNDIDEYEKWYDLAQDSLDTIQDLKLDLAEISKTQFDNLCSEFDAVIGKIESANAQLQNEADLLEEQGYAASKYLYGELIKQEESNLEQLNKEQTALINALNNAVSSGNIEKYSEDWYSMQSNIDDVSSAIQDAKKSLAEYNNEMRQVSWDAFDRTQDNISNLIDESDFIVNLLKSEGTTNDKGNLNDNGLAAQALLAQKYQLYLAKSNEYASELKKINKELANDPYNTTLLDRKQELIKAQQDAISSAQDEKDAIKDLIKEGYDSWLDSLSDTISKYKDLMSEIKDAWDYQNTIEEKTSILNTLYKQQLAYAGDTSEEGKKNSQSVNSQIVDAEKDLKQTEYEKLISDTEKLLDDLQSNSEELFNARLDDLDTLIQDVINQTNENTGAIADTIISSAEKYGFQLSESMTNIWKNSTDDLTNILGQYSDKFINGQSTLQDTVDAIKGFTERMLANSDAKAANEIAAQQAAQDADNSNSSSDYDTGNWDSGWDSGSSDGGDSGSGSDDWAISKYYYPQDLNIDTSVVDRLKWNNIDASFEARSRYWDMLIGDGQYYSDYDQNITLLNWLKNNGYANGTKSAAPGWHLFDENGIGSEGILTKEGRLLNFGGGEKVLSKNAMDKLYDMANGSNSFKNLQTLPISNIFYNLPAMPDIISSSNSATQNVNVDIGGITMNEVNDPAEFKTQLCNALAKDSKVKNIVNTNVFNSMTGGNSLSSMSLL